uniref:CCHC-type domain-containing protein n=1 Tax=Globodera pallida TaxID=36090 RepID=A0A183C9D2_GLOPA
MFYQNVNMGKKCIKCGRQHDPSTCCKCEVKRAAADGFPVPDGIFDDAHYCFACLQAGHSFKRCPSHWRERYEDFMFYNRNRQRFNTGYWFTPDDRLLTATTRRFVHQTPAYVSAPWDQHLAQRRAAADQPLASLGAAAAAHKQRRSKTGDQLVEESVRQAMDAPLENLDDF